MLGAAIYDIHGNLPALEAVLEDIRLANVGQLIVGGDVVLGPMQNEALQCLLALDLPVQFIQGNCEVAVLAEMSGKGVVSLPEQAREVVRWSAKDLRPELGNFLATWPKTLRLQSPTFGDVLFCHGTPRNENEYFTRLTPEASLLPIFDGLDVPVVICGHTHMQFDRIIGSTRVINAGSVGMPFGPPGAYWLLLGNTIKLRHTPYDLAKAADRVRATSYPQAEDFAANNILKPPSEEHMLELFTRITVK